MVNRILYGLLALAVVIVVAFGVTPKLIGMGVRDATVQSMINLIPPETRSQLVINESRFDNGWFRSSSVLDIGYAPLGVGEILTLQLDFDIVHGPLLLTPEGLRLGLAYARIRPAFDGQEITGAMFPISFDLPEARFDLFAGLDQSLEMGLTVDSIEYNDNGAQVSFGGLHGNLLANADLSAEMGLSIGRVQAGQPSSRSGFVLAGLAMQGTTQQMNDLLAPSTTMLEIPALSGSGPFTFNVTDIKAHSELQPSTAGPQRLDIHQQFSIASIESDFPIASVKLSSEINEISSELIRGYYDIFTEIRNQAGANPGTATNSSADQLAQDLTLTAARNSLVFNNLLEANVFEGDHSADIRIDWEGLPQVNNSADIDSEDALAALKVELTVSLDLEAIMRSPAAELVDPYVQQGFIRIDSGRILLDGSLDDGQLVLNGEEVPLDQFF